MLISINIYQIITYLISLVVFSNALRTSLVETKDLPQAFISLFLLGLVSYLIYTNAYMIFKRKNLYRNLTINIWFNFIQIFYISLLGFNFYLFLGLQIMPYFQYNESMNFGVHYEFFNVGMSLAYKKGSDIALGINLIPLIVFLLLSNFKKKSLIEASKDNLDL